MRFRNNIIAFSEKYIGSKYKYGGTTPKGFDCSGYTFFVMNEFNIKLPHNSAAQSRLGTKIQTNQAQRRHPFRCHHALRDHLAQPG